jgi:hypothetical protein
MHEQEKKPTAAELLRLRIRPDEKVAKQSEEHINGVPVRDAPLFVKDTFGMQKIVGAGRTEEKYKSNMDVNRMRQQFPKMEMLRLIVEGYNIKEAARAVGVSYTTGRAYLRDPDVLEELKKLSRTKFDEVYDELYARHESLRERTLALADEALSEMERLLEESNDAIKFKVAQDILDRHGEVSRTQRQVGEHKHVHIDMDTLINAATAANELGGKHKPKLIQAEHFNKPEGEDI